MVTLFYTGNASLAAPAESASESDTYGTPSVRLTTPAGESYMVYRSGNLLLGFTAYNKELSVADITSVRW